MTKSRGRSFLVGVALLGVLTVAMYVAVTATDGPPLADRTQVTAVFTDVGQLQEGDEVRMNSVRIGQVDAIDRGDGAVVTLRLQGDWDLYSDARASLWDLNALGLKFVELHPGTPQAGPLADGVIPREQTTPAMDIDQLLDVLDEPTRTAATSAVRELGSGVAGHGAHLHQFLAAAPDLLADVGTLTGALAAAETDLPALLDSARRLSTELAGRSAELESLVRQTNDTLEAVAVDDAAPLSDTVAALPDTLTAIRQAHEALEAPLADLHTAMTTLGPGAESLGAATDDLRGLLREAPDPLGKVPDVAEIAVPAVQDLTAVLSDLRPLVPKLNQALVSLNPFLTQLAPYSVDIPALADGGAGFTNDQIHDENGLVFGHVRILPVVRLGSGGGLVREGYNPYPEPGTAIHDGSGTPGLIGGDR